METGLRGHAADIGHGRLSWNVDYYRTQDQDDLIFQTALNNPNLAYYTNAGKTLRQGVEANLHYDAGKLHAVLGYAYTNATYQTALTPRQRQQSPGGRERQRNTCSPATPSPASPRIAAR